MFSPSDVHRAEAQSRFPSSPAMLSGPPPVIAICTGFDLCVGAVGVFLICLFAEQTAFTARKLMLAEPAIKDW